MTIGQIHADFAAGRITAREAADAAMALRPRQPRALCIAAVAIPIVIGAAAWTLVFLGGAP